MTRFPVRARGYFVSEVDALITRIEVTLNGLKKDIPPITAAELRETRLAVVVRGYDRREVDKLLQECIRELEAHERGEDDAYRETVSGQVSWLLKWIGEAEFSITRVRPGYVEKDVDDFLDRVAAGLRGEAPAVSGQDARDSVFRSSFLGPGYSEPEVDKFLDELAAALDHLQQY